MSDSDIELVDQEAVEEETQTAATQTQSKPRNAIWDHFVLDKETTKAKCIHCKIMISRGGSGKKATNSAMIAHIKAKHKKNYDNFNEKKTHNKDKESKSSSARQTSIADALTQKVKWQIGDPRAVKLHYRIAEMIAVDNDPLCQSEKLGFCRLLRELAPQYNPPGRTFFTKNVIPDIYTRCKAKVSEKLSTANHVSFTTDIWTNSSNEPFISLTAHWISKEFSFEHAILNSSPLPGSHTGEVIGTKLKQLFDNWDLQKDRRHLVLRDNAANMVKALNDNQILNESCFIHTLQLCIQDSIKSQRAVGDMIASSRKIVTHFSHSAISCHRLKEVQLQLKMTPKKLIQDVETRWNSTYYMLTRLLDQKDCISLLAGEGIITNLTENQWNLLKGTITLLQPFEEITKLISESNCHISEVIPTVATLLRYLTKENNLHFGVGTMKETLKSSVAKRLEDVFLKSNFTKSSFLDPRFKSAFFPSEEIRESVKQALIQEMCLLLHQVSHESSQICSAQIVSMSTEASTAKRQRNETHSSFWECFSELRSNTVCASMEQSTEVQNSLILTSEVSLYLALPLLARTEDPLLWWKVNHINYPNLSRLVKKYLSAPASSIFSERLFSTEGNIYEQTRNRMLPVNGEMLGFLNKTLPQLNYEY